MSNRRLIRFFLFSAVLSVAHYLFYGPSSEIITAANGTLKISDFSHYLIMVRAFWFEGHRGFYEVQEQMDVLTTIAGQQISGIMPLALTPVALFLFGPFAYLSFWGFALAKAAWCGVSLAAVISALCSLHESGKRVPRTCRARYLTMYMIFFCSNAFFITIWLGQTSLVFLAAMIVLLRTAEESIQEAPKMPLPALLVVCLKPTYFGLAMLLLFAYRNWRMMFLSGGMLLLSCALMTIIAGVSWFGIYAEMFSVFSRYPIPAECRLAFVFDRMNVFRSAFTGTLSEQTLVAISKLALLLALFGGIVSIARELLHSRIFDVDRGVIRLIAIAAAYFLFSPYLSTYEDVFLMFLLVLITARRPASVEEKKFLFVLPLLFCSLNFLFLLEFLPRPFLWLMKAAFFEVVLLFILGQRAKSSRSAIQAVQ